MAGFRIGYVLLCDDARKEINGKDILIGVYTTVITVQQLPAVVNLSAWIEVIPQRKGEITFEVKIEVPGNVPPHIVGVVVGIDDEANSFAIATPVANFPLQSEGQIRVLVREQGVQKWDVVKRVNFRYKAPFDLQATLTSAPSPPPD